MQPLPRLPLELCEDIIDIVALYAQVYGSGGVDCKAWHLRALYHLHSSVWLSTRENVRYLFERCRAHPDLQTAVRHVIIRGPSQPAEGGLEPFGPIPHFGTFIAMLARHLPNVAYLRICRAAWSADMFPADTIRYLSAYTTLTQVRLRDVEFKNASQFAALLSALPNLEYVSCTDVSCRARQLVIPFPYPSEGRHVREIVVVNTADELVDVLVKLSKVARAVVKLSHRDWRTMAEPGSSKQCQWLLNAHSEALREVEIIRPNESRIDLSRQTYLSTLFIDFAGRHYPDFPRVLTILSSIKSEELTLAHFRFNIHPENCTSDLWAWNFLEHMMGTKILERIDEVLSRANFAHVPEGGVRFEVKIAEEYQKGIAVLLQSEEWWEQLLAEKMPRSAGRGILACVALSLH